jgi:hypothetical protein
MKNLTIHNINGVIDKSKSRKATLSIKDKILRDPKKVEAILLLSSGYSWKYVAKESRLTVGSLKYWAGFLNVKPTDYRNGKTKYSQEVREKTRVFAMDYLQKELKKLKNKY